MDNKDYVVINNNNGRISNAEIHSVDDFLKAASDELSINGDLYCYIPDFDEKIYSIIKEAVPSSIWFVFDKSEIPSWFNSPEALIINSIKEDDEPDYDDSDDFDEDNFERASQERERQENNFEDYQERPKKVSPKESDPDYMDGIQNLLENEKTFDKESDGSKEAKIYVFGSSKGGTGKTFTCLISARRYAKKHPSERIAIVDFDIIDGQVGISIHMTRPTMMDYYRSWINGQKDFKTMYEYRAISNSFPGNVDFYLAPKDYYISKTDFWINCLENLVSNYDTVFFDTGIDYINYEPISYVYKLADRIVLVSTTSIKSVSSVLKQINKLIGVQTSSNSRGEEVFNKSDGIGPKLRLAITGCNKDDPQNNMILETFKDSIKISAIFGQLSTTINKCEYYGEWDIFDNNQKFNESLDALVDLNDE